MRYLLRRLAQARSFTAITLLTLAIGIGATTTVFSVVNGVLLNPLPYPDSDRLVSVWQTAPGIGVKDLNASPATYFTYREESRTMEDIGLWSGGSVSVTGIAEPEQVEALFVTDGILPLLRVQPALGRWFTLAEDQPSGPETVVLTHAYWQARFGGNPGVLGTRITIDGTPRDVIGIMPESFRFLNRNPSVFLPLRFDRSRVFIGNFSYQAIARLKPGVTIEQVNADVARMIPMLQQKFSPPAGMSFKMFEDARLAPAVRFLKEDVVGNIGTVLGVLMATVGMVLFIACANVANLLLARAEGRQQEFAIRSALGASRGIIARELLFESTALGLAGGALGLALAHWALQFLVYLRPSVPRLAEISIDTRVILFTMAISLLAGLTFGLAPVFRYAGTKIGTALRAGGRTISEGRERHRTRNALVVVQMSLALVLLVGSGLMIRTFVALRNVHPGFTGPEQILTLRVSIPSAQVPDPKRVARMFHDIADRMASIGGVASLSLTNSVTLDGNNNADPIFVEDRPTSESQLPPIRRFKHVSPGYFKTMGNPILAGRDFTWTDIHEMRPVAMLSENLAREYWGSAEAALGKRVRENPKGIWREIIGITGNERDSGLERDAPKIVYWPLLKERFWNSEVDVRRSLVFAIRSPRAGTTDFISEIRQAVWAINSNLPVANVRTQREVQDRSMARTSFTLVMLGIAAGMALLLGIVGVYGVISYSVSQRTREIGIRIALGAKESAVRAMFVRHSLLLAAIGVACGVAIAIPLGRFMTTLLYQVAPLDLITYLTAVSVLMAAAMLAAYLPARRATRIDPGAALRSE